MEVKSVAVIGAGRMGSLIASKLPTEIKKIVIDKDRDKAREVAEQVEAEYSDKIEMAAAADMIMMVLPTPAIKEMVGKLMDVVKDGTTILNMATTAQIEPAMVLNNRDIAIIDTKIIGHAKRSSAVNLPLL
jgi:prephenate dehydrogenase